MNLKKYIYNFYKHLEDFVLYSPIQSKFFLFFCILALIITTIKYYSLKGLLIQIIVYYIILEDISCNIHGGCTKTAWIKIVIPVITILVFILDYLKFFNLEKKIKIFLGIFKKINISENNTIIIDKHKYPI